MDKETDFEDGVRGKERGTLGCMVGVIGDVII